MKKIKDILVVIVGFISLLLICIYFPLAGLFKFNFGIYGFNAIGVCIAMFFLVVCMTLTDHLDLNLKKKEKKDEISEEDKWLVNRLEKNPDLLNRITVELRKRKINKLKQKI